MAQQILKRKKDVEQIQGELNQITEENEKLRGECKTQSDQLKV